MLTPVLIPATIDDYPTIQNMARFYVYDMYRYCGHLEGWECPEDGLFECVDLKKYITPHLSSPGCVETKYSFLIRINGELAGFVMLDKPAFLPGVDWHAAEFYILAKFQGKGIGTKVALQLFDLFSGCWSLGSIPQNTKALGFWEDLISNYTNGNFSKVDMTSEQLATADRPDPNPLTMFMFETK